MFGLPWIDVLVIVGYFGLMIAIGLWSMRLIRGQEDYFLAGRRFGKFIQTFAAFGQATSTENVVGTTRLTFTDGASGIWSNLSLLFTTPVYWLTSPWYRRLRVTTMGDFFADRYGSKAMAAVYGVMGTIFLMSLISLGINAMSKTILAITPKAEHELNAAERAELAEAQQLAILEKRDYGTLSPAEREQLEELRLRRPRSLISHIDETLLVWSVCLVVLAYGMAGGLHAAFLTDVVQGLLVIVLTLLLLPFSWWALSQRFGSGNFWDFPQVLHQRLPAAFFDIFGSPAVMNFTWYWIVALCFMASMNVAVQPNQLVAIASAKDEYAGRFGFTTGTFMKRFATVIWGYFALAAAALYTGIVTDPDLVWGHATRDLLGPLGLGLIGLMIACLMAALMSTVSCLMITAASLLTLNVYRPLVPQQSERHYVLVGRLVGAGVVVGGAAIAQLFADIFSQLKYLWEFLAVFAASVWLGILWRPATRQAAWAAITAGLLFFFLLPLGLPLLWPSLRTNEYLAKRTAIREVSREYRASAEDVVRRAAAIAQWDAAHAAGVAKGPRPEPLVLHQPFTQTFSLKAQSVFWSQDLRPNRQGTLEGRGVLHVELVLLDLCGWDLSRNPYALNETLRYLIRTLVPFVIIFVVSSLTRHDDPAAVARFYAKMKTPVLVDRAADAQELHRSYAEPHRFDHKKLWPNSGWEFCKWDRVAAVGFVVCLGAAFAVIGLLYGLVSLGR